ncbi:MAG: PD-(D/E)XK nuclease family protein, partial [Bacteroidales bacterium]|nr:PD-(D/E)XK nuclease family protein [Bacteroidales bacterium]
VRELEFHGVTTRDDAKLLEAQLHTMISDPETAAWFDGSCRVVNERNIMPGNGQKMKRPDRIMFNGREIIVIDYKSGQKESKYLTQVRNYMNALHQCFPDRHIKGFIWYTRNNERICV